MSTRMVHSYGNYYQSRKIRQRIGLAILIAVLTALAIIILMPLWWMISTSLKSLNEIMSYPPTWIPKSFHWENYRLTWSKGNFTRYTLNTLLLAGVGVITHVLSNTFIAYGFAKIKFPGRQMLFTVMLGTMMIPGFVTLIPTYIMFAKIHWVGTYLPLMVPGLFGSAYQIFLVRQFYMSIPNELIEAGKIDGASHYYIWWKIMIPLAKPAVVVIAIMTFQGAWNDFLGPLIYISKESMFNLQIGLQSFKGQETTQWHYLMAGSLIVLAPVIALFFFFQRYFIEGMNISSGTKG